MQILWNFPTSSETNFKPQYNQIEWRNNEQEFKKWCEGKTGYPIVDAGMRELKPNRLHAQSSKNDNCKFSRKTPAY